MRESRPCGATSANPSEGYVLARHRKNSAEQHDRHTATDTQANSLRIIGNAKGKGPIVSFEMKGAHPHDVATVIDREGVVRAKLWGAKTLPRMRELMSPFLGK